MLAFPAQASVLAPIALFSLARLVSYAIGSGISIEWLPNPAVSGNPATVFGFVLGLIVDAVLMLLALKVAVEALLNTAKDRLGPTSPGQFWATDHHAVGQLLLWLIFMVGTYLLALLFGKDAGWLALLLGSFALPAAIAVHALGEDLWHALNPLAWMELLARVGAGYFGAVVVLGAAALLVFGLETSLLSHLPGWLDAVASRFVELYALVFAYHVLGALLHRHHEALAIDAGPTIARPILANLMEDQAMQQADTLATRGDALAASEVLRTLMHRHGASAPIHVRYRQLLRDRQDLGELMQHSRIYVPALLALGQPKQALALYLESRALDPGFQLDVPEDVTRLFNHALATGQSQLAVELIEGFATRFPRNADVPANLLACARVMAERLNRPEEAVHLLEGLPERFPEHPLLPEVERALAEIGAIRAMGKNR